MTDDDGPTTIINAVIIDPSRDELRESEKYEDVLKDNGTRWVLLPLEYPSLFEFYKKIERGFWTSDDFDWGGDASLLRDKCPNQLLRALQKLSADYLTIHGHPARLSESENRSVSQVYFNDFLDLTSELTEAVQSPEARAFLGFQAMFECFQRETFTQWSSVCAASLGLSSVEMTHVDHRNVPSDLGRKNQWLTRHLEGFYASDKIKILAGDDHTAIQQDAQCYLNAAPMAEVLVALGALYGMFFSGLSVLRQLLARYSLEDSAVFKSAKKLQEELTLHSDFAFHLYASFDAKLSSTTLCKLLVQSAQIELEHLETVFSAINHGPSELRTLRGGMISLVERTARRMLHSAQYFEPGDIQERSEAELTSLFKHSLGGLDIGNASAGARTLFEIPQPLQLKYSGAFRIVPIEKKAQHQHGQFQADGDGGELQTGVGNNLLILQDEDF